MKKLTIVLASFFVLLAIALGVVAFMPDNVTPITPESPVPVSVFEGEENLDPIELKIIYEENNSDTYPMEFGIGQTAFSVLEDSLDTNGVEMIVEEYDFGSLVTSINGYDNSTEMAWIYYVNDNAGDVAADQKELEPGDLVEWKYVEPIY